MGITIQEMMDAGAHFGHQTKKWNPKMRPYIYGARSGIHILDLQQTHGLALKAFNAIEEIVAGGDSILFVGTKKQAQTVIEEAAKKCSMPYVTRRWLGGMLTNFSTIRKSVERFIELETKREKNEFSGYTKRELLGIDREIAKFQHALGGIKNLRRPPGAVFVVDPHLEKIAVHESNVLGIPVIAVTDSNCDPDPIDYLIPANDDALKSVQVFAERAAEAVLAGMEKRELRAREEASSQEGGKKKLSRKAQAIVGAGKAYVTKTDSFEGKGEVESFSATVDPVLEPSAEPAPATPQEKDE